MLIMVYTDSRDFQYIACECEVTDGGSLLLRDECGSMVAAFAHGNWNRVEVKK